MPPGPEPERERQPSRPTERQGRRSFPTPRPPGLPVPGGSRPSQAAHGGCSWPGPTVASPPSSKYTLAPAAFVPQGATTSTTPLVNAGPVNCCTPPSGGFTYSGTTPLSVQAGDTYG